MNKSKVYVIDELFDDNDDEDSNKTKRNLENGAMEGEDEKIKSDNPAVENEKEKINNNKTKAKKKHARRDSLESVESYIPTFLENPFPENVFARWAWDFCVFSKKVYFRLAMVCSQHDHLVIPSESKWIQAWDAMVLLLLLCMAWTVPFEIGVTGGHLWLSYGLMGVLYSQIINLVFVIDTTLYFFRVTKNKKGFLVWRLKDITYHYLTGWFFFDLLSCFPAELIAYAYNITTHSWNFRILLILSTLKLLRLSRISRRFRNSPMLLKFSLRISHGPIQVIRVFIISFYVAHCMACLWCFINNLQERPVTWITKFVNQQKTELDPLSADLPANQLDMYVLSLYWACVTLVSLGYGDVVPYTRVEYWVSCFMIMISAFLWAWVVASMVDIVSTLQAEENALRFQLAVVNRLAREYRPKDKKLLTEWNGLMDESRMFLQLSFWRNQKVISFTELTETANKILSVDLTRRVELLSTKDTLAKVGYFSTASDSTVSFIAEKLIQRRMNAGEMIFTDKENILIFLRFGLCFIAYTQLGSGKAKFKIIGQDSIHNFNNFLLKDSTHPLWRKEAIKALTFCDSIVLKREDFTQVLERDENVRKSFRWRLLRMGLGKWAREVNRSITS